jgi:omega-amidase
MRVSAVQMSMRQRDRDYNFTHAEELIRKAAEGKPDVILLPETWETGFCPEYAEELCDNAGERLKALFSPLARELNVNIVAGSISDRRGGNLYNTSYIFGRSGKVAASYDKTHLFTYMGENLYYRAGRNLVTFELDGVMCATIICYDLRFPELTRTLALSGIDVLFIVAQWPEARIDILRLLSRARAAENQCFAALCNSCGTAGRTVFGGCSALIDPMGRVAAEAGTGEEIISADFDLGKLISVRNSINVFKDRRPCLYKLV